MASPLLDQLMNDIKTAMKNRETETLTVLRTIHAQIKDATTNAGREATDADVATVLAKAIKQRQDSIEQFKTGGRADLAEKEEREIQIIKRYQPQQLTEPEIQALVKKCMAETGAQTKKEMGKVMQALMPHVKGKADGKIVNQIVSSLLT